MIIAIPVVEKTIESSVNPSFGRSPYFLLYDVKKKKVSYLNNDTASKSHGGAGIRTAQILVDHNVTDIIAPRCGENALEVLRAANIRAYQSIAGTTNENIEAFLSDKLLDLEMQPSLHKD